MVDNETAIIGRKKEIQQLDVIIQSKKLEFQAVSGSGWKNEVTMDDLFV